MADTPPPRPQPAPTPRPATDCGKLKASFLALKAAHPELPITVLQGIWVLMTLNKCGPMP